MGGGHLRIRFRPTKENRKIKHACWPHEVQRKILMSPKPIQYSENGGLERRPDGWRSKWPLAAIQDLMFVSCARGLQHCLPNDVQIGGESEEPKHVSGSMDIKSSPGKMEPILTNDKHVCEFFNMLFSVQSTWEPNNSFGDPIPLGTPCVPLHYMCRALNIRLIQHNCCWKCL